MMRIFEGEPIHKFTRPPELNVRALTSVPGGRELIFREVGDSNLLLKPPTLLQQPQESISAPKGLK
ncbi:hypothetical protein A3C59_05040 [Candidatus Daviesbacteria bacterium RIFCSPHIGHO2_02_FULL_36_13]|uniref:Uncharacterized protein n=1 Tax=Candidatus Daviesbacteria bacterium RIFCSPHIGHO2_02_FULL_36_13 TaxID=1797768 RepID=A0A1F5JXV2_9BACT|nr:MAG: hypothetical protein A3C59_05040 [Candidatus Daviesbacteria bacterium RIFCSPHIGHO2_02_FULL_36_13]OGE44421.1 MAG: hypothetical protein A3A45_00320 [Candidatus Daviesbacteria bacterium RIFCSPLOWO2_01_FULL_36_8]